MSHRPLRHPPADCPVCRQNLVITRLSCTACGTELTGSFDACMVCALEADDRALLELFLLSRGNMKEIERRLGVSYPTARGRIEILIDKLGLHPPERDRLGTLEALSRGEIDVDDAMAALDDP
ncbi:MAG: DUF2089 domain-containing protein [Solirubrobacteraceae bacterium]